MDCANRAGRADSTGLTPGFWDSEPRCIILKRYHEPALTTSRRVRGMSSWFAGACIANPQLK